MIDYERAIWSAIKETMEVKITGCYFHFTKFIRKNMDLKHQTHDALEDLLLNISSLCFIPPDRVLQKYSLIRDHYQN